MPLFKAWSDLGTAVRASKNENIAAAQVRTNSTQATAFPSPEKALWSGGEHLEMVGCGSCLAAHFGAAGTRLVGCPGRASIRGLPLNPTLTPVRVEASFTGSTNS